MTARKNFFSNVAQVTPLAQFSLTVLRVKILTSLNSLVNSGYVHTLYTANSSEELFYDARVSCFSFCDISHDSRFQ